MQNNYPGGCKTQKYVNLSSFSDVDALNSSFWNWHWKQYFSELLSPKDSSHILSCSLVIWMTIVLKITFVLGNHWYLDNQTRSHRQSQEDELFVSWMLLAWSMKTDWPVCLCDIAWHVTPVACINCDWSILILRIGDHALFC